MCRRVSEVTPKAKPDEFNDKTRMQDGRAQWLKLTVDVNQGVQHSLVTLHQHRDLLGHLLCNDLER